MVKLIYFQLFVSDKGFVYMVPMPPKKLFPEVLKQFTKEIGASTELIVDPSAEKQTFLTRLLNSLQKVSVLLAKKHLRLSLE